MRQATVQRPDLEATIDADFDQVWYLVSDYRAWPGLMPHIHAVNVLDQHAGRTLLHIDARRGWLPVQLCCGVAKSREERKGKREEYRKDGVVHRWYISGPWRGTVETWRVTETAGNTTVHVTITAPNRLSRFAGKTVILPLARRTLAMTRLLAEAHRDVHGEPG